MSERDWESEARQQGWKPEDQYTGDPERWTDAKTFVEKGEKIAGILKSKVERLESRLDAAERANKEFGQYHKQTIEKEKQKSAERIAELESKLAQAITDGDGAAAVQLNRDIASERSNVPQEIPTNTIDYNKMADDWRAQNSWYDEDQDLQIYADGVAGRIIDEGYQGKAYFNELTRRVKSKFPEKFGNPRKNGANTVEDGGERDTPASKTAHTYENLPPDAKAACDRFVKQGLMKKEDYVKTFEWE